MIIVSMTFDLRFIWAEFKALIRSPQKSLDTVYGQCCPFNRIGIQEKHFTLYPIVHNEKH